MNAVSTDAKRTDEGPTMAEKEGTVVHSEVEWEEIVALARRIDRGVASHQGIDAEGVLRLARAVTSFQHRVTAKSGRTLERDPASNGGNG